MRMGARVKNISKSIRLLVGLGLLISATQADAAIKCQIREGSGCGGPVIYEMQLCAVVTFAQGKCVDQCASLRPICKVEGFDSWVDAYQENGRDGIKGPLITNSDSYDEFGVLAYTSEKNYTVCMRTSVGNIIVNYTPPIPVSAPIACPKVAVATAESCKNGTVFNPATQQCEIQDPSCGSGGNSTITDVIRQGLGLVATQNNHFSTNSGIKPEQMAITANTTQLPGLQTPTKESSSAISFGGSNLPTRRSARSSGSAASAASGSGGLATGADNSGGAEKDKKKEDDSAGKLASAEFGKGEGYGNAGMGEAGAQSGSGSGAGVSWFGSKSSTPGEGGAEVAFKQDGSGASRGLASSGESMSVEDPTDYFLKSDIDTSLFKRVTAQFRKKEKDLVLSR